MAGDYLGTAKEFCSHLSGKDLIIPEGPLWQYDTNFICQYIIDNT